METIRDPTHPLTADEATGGVCQPQEWREPGTGQAAEVETHCPPLHDVGPGSREQVPCISPLMFLCLTGHQDPSVLHVVPEPETGV